MVGSPILVGHRPPFDAGGEGGSAPSQQSGGGDLGNDPVVSHRQGGCKGLVATEGPVIVEARRVDHSDPGQQP